MSNGTTTTIPPTTQGQPAAATTSTQNPFQIQSVTPGYKLPYAVQGATAAQQLLSTPYTPYSGERVADQSNLTTQAYNTAAGMGVPGAVGAASTVTGSLLSGLGGAPSSFTDQGIASMYMNPYMTNVLDVQQQRAQREYQQALRDYGLKSAGRSAFGGSRQALGEAALGEGYMRGMNELTAKGLAGAYEAAQGQFNKEQEAARARTELGFKGAEQLGKMGMQEQTAGQNYVDMLRTLGSAEEANRQKRLDIDYQNFIAQRDYPEQRLKSFTDILNALPSGQVTETRTAADPFTQMLPLILGSLTTGGGAAGIGQIIKDLLRQTQSGGAASGTRP